MWRGSLVREGRGRGGALVPGAEDAADAGSGVRVVALRFGVDGCALVCIASPGFIILNISRPLAKESGPHILHRK